MDDPGFGSRNRQETFFSLEGRRLRRPGRQANHSTRPAPRLKMRESMRLPSAYGSKA